MTSYDSLSQQGVPYFDKEVFLASREQVLRAGGTSVDDFGVPHEVVVAVQPPSQADNEYFGYPTCIHTGTRCFKPHSQTTRPETIKVIVPKTKNKERDKLFSVPSLDSGYAADTESEQTKEESDSSDPDSEGYLGSITFSLAYKEEEGELVVGILQARDIPIRDFSGTVDSYVEVFLTRNPDEKKQTRVMRANKYPKFNEFFHLPVCAPCDDTLCILVVDFDMYSRHQVIGEITHPLQEAQLTERAVTFVKPIKSTETPVFRGDVLCCLTLQHCKINMCVITARNLKAGDLHGPVDSLVKVTMFNGEQKVKTKKTSLRTGTRDPVFNESADFNTSHIDYENIRLRVTVFDFSDKQHPEIIGFFDIGSQSTGSGAEHWEQMMSHPGSTFVHWHRLVNYIH